MNRESQVCRLELSKRLRELGVNKKSLFFYYYKCNAWLVAAEEFLPSYVRGYQAYTSAELGEILPEEVSSLRRYGGLYICENQDHIEIDLDSEANARAKMLIYLIENKMMEVPK